MVSCNEISPGFFGSMQFAYFSCLMASNLLSNSRTFFLSDRVKQSFKKISSYLWKYATHVTSSSGLYLNSPIELITEYREKSWSYLGHLFLRIFQRFLKKMSPVVRGLLNAIFQVFSCLDNAIFRVFLRVFLVGSATFYFLGIFELMLINTRIIISNILNENLRVTIELRRKRYL